MSHVFQHWRRYAGLGLLLFTELVLFGAAEGQHKGEWIMAGTIPNLLLALGFIFKG